MLKNAQWIWVDEPFEVNQYVCFEAEFFAENPVDIFADVSVSGEYALYINDMFAGFGQFGNWPGRMTYNEHDISEYCVQGKNSFRLSVWHMGIDCSVAVAGEGRACFSVAQAERTLLSSGADTMCCLDNRYVNGEQVPMITGQLGFSFEYHALEKIQIMKPAKICAGPEECSMRPVPYLKMETLVKGAVCFQGYFIDAQENLPALRMMKSALSHMPSEAIKDGENRYTCRQGDGISLIYDLGKERAGYFSMDIELEKDAVILIGWGEHLKDMRVRTAIDGRNFCAVYRGVKGKNSFVHPFRRMGCRYIQIHVYADAVTVNHVGLIPVIYPMPKRYMLDMGDALHRRIYETALDTLELCVHDHYEDCPWREQALYAMDSRIQILCGYYAFEEKRMPKASIELLAQGLREDGLLEICAPAKASITIPCFSLAWIVELWEYVLYTGDTHVDALADTALTILNAMDKKLDEEDCVLHYRQKKYWNFYEWQPGLDGHGPGRKEDYTSDMPDGLLTAWYAIALDHGAMLMDVLGRGEEAAALRLRLAKANRALERFWNEDRGVYAAIIKEGKQETWSSLMQALVLLSGACPKDRAGKLRQRLKSQQGLIPVTLNDALLRYQALMQEEEIYADFVFEDIARVWGRMLMEGATSFWETELGEADFHNAGSLCHGWSAGPVYFYHAYGRGLRPESPGKMKKYPVYQRVLGKF